MKNNEISFINFINCMMLTMAVNGQVDFNIRKYAQHFKGDELLYRHAELKKIFDKYFSNSDKVEQTNNYEIFKCSDVSTINDILLINKDTLGYSYNAQKELFIQKIDRTLPLKLYTITDWELIPFLLLEYLNNPTFIKSIKLEIFVPKNLTINFIDYFKFEATVNAIELLENNKTNVKENSKKSCIKKETMKKRENFSRQQQRIFNELGDYVKKYNILSISKDDLYEIMHKLNIDEKNIDSALSRLNAQYKEIYNTDINIIKNVDIKDGLWVLHNAWQVPKILHG